LQPALLSLRHPLQSVANTKQLQLHSMLQLQPQVLELELVQLL
jgi:hypothetical protein